MSTDLLVNLDKPTSKKATLASNSSNKTEMAEKKGGQSLFDSLLSQAKQETSTSKKEDSSSEKKTQNNTEAKTENQKSSDKKIENPTDNKTQTVTENKLNIKNTEKVMTTVSADEVKNTQSLQKMIDKLVDMVVSATKDILDKNPKQETTDSGDKELNKVVKNTVEDVINNKLADVTGKEKVKTLINDKLEIIKSSVEIIKNELGNKEILASSKTSENTKNVTIKNDISTETVLVKNLDDVIESEIKIIKDNVQEIKKEVSKIIVDEVETLETKKVKTDEDVRDNTKNKTEIKKEVSNIISDAMDTTDTDESQNQEIKKQINSSLKTIEVSSSDIKDESLNLLKNENTQDSKTIASKVEYKLDVIKDEVVQIKEKVSEIIIVKTTVDQKSELENTKSNSFNLINLSSATNTKQNVETINNEKPLLATMFLNAQKSIKEKTSLEQVHDAKTNIVEKKTLESVKTSAEKLDLGLVKSEIKNEGDHEKKSVSIESKKEETKINNLFSRDLNRVFLDQRIETTQIANQRTQQLLQQEQITIVEESKKIVDTIELAVPKEAVQVIQAKIIGAHQKMGSFMSEVARNMYLNYKPPVSAFRVNLNPANLGSISIIMKANKVDNSLSVSMNLSSSNTMEAFTENKVALQNAIQRQFTETSNVSINFNMQDQGSNDSFDQQGQNNNNQNNKGDGSKSTIDNTEEQEIVENHDYM